MIDFKSSNMTQAEIDELMAAPRFAVVGTNRKDGAPQMTPVWYLYRDGLIYISVFRDSAKYKNLMRDPRVTVTVAAEHPDTRAVTFTGIAEILPEGEDADPWILETVWTIFRRYLTSDEATNDYVKAEGPRELNALLVIKPEKVLAQDFND